MKKTRVLIKNRTAQFIGPYPVDAFKKEWSYSVPGFHFFGSRFRGWDGRKNLLAYNRVPAGLFWATKDDVKKKLGVRWRIKNEVYELELRKKSKWLVSDPEKYYYQNDCVDAMIDAAPRGGGLVLNATGSGKTRIAAMLFSRIKGYCLFVVDQLDLLEQAQKEIEEALGEKVGYVGNSIFKPRRVTVATVQTLARHQNDAKFEDWVCSIVSVVIDEIHVQINKRNFDVVENICPIAVYGLTATLQLTRKDVRLRAYALSGPILYTYPLEQGQRDGVLSKGVAVCVSLKNEIPRKKRGAHNYQTWYEFKIVDNIERNYVITELVKEARRRKKYTVLLVQRIAHLKKLHKKLKSIPHRLAFGGKLVRDRQKSVKKFEKGKVRLIIANQVFKKGVNIKRLDVIIDAAGLYSKDDAVQKYGRGLRLHAEKHGLLYFDISDVDKPPVVTERFVENEEGVRVLKKVKGPDNPFRKAAKSRMRALKKAGIPVKVFKWEDQGEASEAFELAERFLKREMKRDDSRKKSRD